MDQRRSWPARVGRVLGFMALAVLLMVGVAYSAGAVNVRVEEHKPDGTRLWLPLPAAAAPFVVHFLPEEEFRNFARDLNPWLPAIQIASRELQNCPDGLLVAVDTPRETVKIEKRGGSLVIDVETGRESVHLTVPLGTIRAVARAIESRQQRS